MPANVCGERATMPKMTFRFAVPEDAPAFARWAAENPDIPEKDLAASLQKNNPTATVLVVEEELNG